MLSVKKKRKLNLVFFLVLLPVMWWVHGVISGWMGVEVRNEGVSFGWEGGWLIFLNLILLLFLV